MSRMLELTDPIYEALQEAALAAGMTPEAWIAAHLPQATTSNGETAEIKSEPPKTLAERFAGRFGRIASGGQERLSENTGERFTDYLEAKRREGRL